MKKLLLSSLCLILLLIFPSNALAASSTYDIDSITRVGNTYTMHINNYTMDISNVTDACYNRSSDTSTCVANVSGFSCNAGANTCSISFEDPSQGFIYPIFFNDNGDAMVSTKGFAPVDIAPEFTPQISSLPDQTITDGDTYATAGSFTDSDSTSWTATVDYGDGSGSQPLPLSSMNFSLNHQYTTNGTYTVTVSVTDNQGAIGTTTTDVTVSSNLNSVSPATVYIHKGLLNLGVKFDLKAEVYKDNTLVTSGQINSVNPGIGATAETIPFNSFSPVSFPSGSALTVEVYARTACTGSLLGSGTATLSYNNASVDSRFGATIGTASSTYHLLNSFVLGTTAGHSTKTVAVSTGAKCSTFKPFGTWTVTP